MKSPTQKTPSVEAATREIAFAQAINEALAKEMRRDPTVFIIGEDGAALGHPLARAVDFPSPHKRACSAISARAWRASSLRCLRNTAPSLASRACLRTFWAYWRSAVRTSAERLRRRDEVSVSASRSLAVASSIAIVFICRIISALLDCAQGFRSVPLAKADKVIK